MKLEDIKDIDGAFVKCRVLKTTEITEYTTKNKDIAWIADTLAVAGSVVYKINQFVRDRTELKEFKTGDIIITAIDQITRIDIKDATFKKVSI